MFRCGLLRLNFSLAIGILRALFQVERILGAGSGNRTRIFSLEGCCTTIVLYPRCRGRDALVSPQSAPRRGGGSRTRTYEGVRQGIYSPPPLPLGTFPLALGAISRPLNKSLPPRLARGIRAPTHGPK